MRIARGISVTNTSRPVGITYDADATAFFTAASITDTTQKSAVNTLVLSLKSANIWTKMLALYPICGGVANSHAVNLKQPGTFNLSFTTGWTHSSNGMTPSNAYADTFLTPSTALSQNNTHVSVYSRTDTNSGGAPLGSNKGAPNYTNQLAIIPKSGNLFYGSVNQSVASSISNLVGTGFYLAKRTVSTGIVLQKNNTQTSVTINSSGLSTFKLSIGATNAGGSFFYDPNQLSFASIGDGLTDAEALSFYNAVQAYQTTLNRQV